jgi:hypothetical protein
VHKQGPEDEVLFGVRQLQSGSSHARAKVCM